MGLQFTELKKNTYEVSEKSIKIGVASSKAEKECIYQLRYQVYVEEMGKEPPTSVNHEKKEIVDDLDDWSILLYAKAGSELIGTLRVTMGTIDCFSPVLQKLFFMKQFAKNFIGGDQRQALSTKMAVIPEYRCSQTAYLLLSKGYEIYRDEQLQFIFGGCSPSLLPLYERLGFQRLPHNFVDPGYGLIIPLILISEDIEHLRLVKSPLLRIARKRFNNLEASKWFSQEFPHTAKVVNSQLISKDALWEYVGNRLGQYPLLAIQQLKGLSEEQAKDVLHMGTIFHCAPGDYIVNRGEIAREWYILLSGRVKVRSGVLISERVPGESFGKPGLIAPQVQVEDIYAITQLEVMVISQQSFEKMRRFHADIAAKVLENMASKNAFWDSCPL